jgi:hypothetical protein
MKNRLGPRFAFPEIPECEVRGEAAPSHRASLPVDNDRRIAGIFHDLRDPLAVVRSWASLTWREWHRQSCINPLHPPFGLTILG